MTDCVTDLISTSFNMYSNVLCVLCMFVKDSKSYCFFSISICQFYTQSYPTCTNKVFLGSWASFLNSEKITLLMSSGLPRIWLQVNQLNGRKHTQEPGLPKYVRQDGQIHIPSILVTQMYFQILKNVFCEGSFCYLWRVVCCGNHGKKKHAPLTSNK